MSQFLDDYSSSDEAVKPKLNKTRRKKTNRFWKIEKEFECTAEAENFLKNEQKWGYHYKNVTEEGIKRIYRCKVVKARGVQCVAGIMLLYLNESDKVILYRSELDHNCDCLETKSTQGLNEDVKIKIQQLFDLHLKPNAILSNLNKMDNVLVPTKGQLNNYLQRLRVKKYGRSTISLAELKKYLIQNSTTDDDTSAYVCAYEIDEEEGSFRFFISSNTLLNNAVKSNIIHCDATYKIIWQGYPVLVIGTSDLDRHFHIIGLSVCCSEKTEDYIFLFQSLKLTIHKVFDCHFVPKVLVSDAAISIRIAFQRVFGNDCTIIMCWAHMKRNVEKKVLLLVPKEFHQEIIADIETLQLCSTIAIFDTAYKLFSDKWSKFEEFISYFYNEWISTNKNWFEGIMHKVPSTNNCLEAWNNKLKNDHTHRERAPLSRFIKYSFDWINTWSLNYIKGSANFSSEVTISFELWSKSYQWLKLKKKIAKPEIINNFFEYRIPPNDKVELENARPKIFSFTSFEEYEKNIVRYWTVRIPINMDWRNGTCDCSTFFKKYLCKHLIGLAVQQKLLSVPLEAKNIPMGQKPKRGRPKKAKKALIVQ